MQPLPPELAPRPSPLQRLLRLSPWQWVILGIALIPVALVPIVGLARYTTSGSSYCLTCHGTGETPDRSQPSLVHPSFPKVSCVDCHSKPGQVVYEGYVKGFMAEPERVSPACARCHSTMTRTNESAGFQYNFLDIRITHQAHVERGASCVTCHGNIAHDLSPVPTNRPRMESCYSCHARTDTCTKCHSAGIPPAPPPPPAPASGDMLGDGRVYYLRICSACHGPSGDRVKGVQLFSRDYQEKKGEEALVQAISQGRGRMHGFGLERQGPLAPAQVKALLGYLEEEATGGPTPQPETLYQRYCLTCHGEKGDQVAGIALFSLDKDQEALFRAVQLGKGGMQPFGRGEGGPLIRQEIQALLEYLREKSGAATPAPALDGRALYQEACSACHGPDGSALKGGEEDMRRAIIQGKGAMPPMAQDKGGTLSPEETEAIVQFLLRR